MSTDREGWILESIELLEVWPHIGKENSARRVAFAEAIGWIREEITTAPCQSCSHPREVGRYYSITPAGRAALELHRIHTARLAYAEGKAEGFKSVAEDRQAELESERAADAERAEIELRTGFTEDDFA